MSDYLPRHQRIITHATTKLILHIECALDIGKLHVDLWAFQRGKGHSGHAEAYIDADEARLLVEDLAAGQLPERFQAIGGRANGEIIARVLTIEETDEGTRLPLRLRVENGPGIQNGGLIQPTWWGKGQGRATTSLSMLLDWRTARKIALAVREHMHAWAAATILQRKASAVWQPDESYTPIEEEAAEPIEQTDEPRSITAFQRKKIEELYGAIWPQRDPLAGANNWFRQHKGHPIHEATYDEGSSAIAALLRVKQRQQVAS